MFDPCGPLPTGTSVLEASAGTGKTHTIGSLVTRYVAEGVAELDDLLIITFGRAASQELRERVRGALVQAERAFIAGTSSDDVLAMLLDVDEAERTERLGRLRQALVNFDAATIATTHQFCELVLRSLGVAGDSDTVARFVESLDELLLDVVDDLYLQQYGNAENPPPFDRTAALALARTVVEDPQAAIADADPAHPLAAARVDFARRVREELDRRKRRAGLLSYDDLLSQVADALADGDSLARLRMRQRWSIVLVDEFQDTDPVQWQVLDRAFTGHATVVLIGDPKQAIYAFRGGDVTTYLTAADTATERWSLGTNRRSDEPLVNQLNTVFHGAQLGDPRITAGPVEAHLAGSRLTGAGPAVRIRQVRRGGFSLTRGGDIKIGDAREFIARDCAGDIAELLGSGALWDGAPISAGQVAVIVGVRDHGQLIQRELAAVGVPAVLAGGGDVFRTVAADEWLVLLKAMDAPQRTALVRAAAIGPFFGVGIDELDRRGDLLTAEVADTLRVWASLLRTRGLAAVIEAADAEGLGARVLRRPDGERLMTDLRHLGQSLHEVGIKNRLGLTGLIGWFRDERTDAARAERPRRLESDASAVQIVTIHGSKGLQYPVTYVPFGFQRRWGDEVDTALFHDESGVRTLDVAQAGKDWSSHASRHWMEDDGEELRKLYVAMTRAQSQLVMWWAPTTVTARGALHRLLFGRQPGTAEVPAQMPVRDDEYATSVLNAIQALGGPVREDAVVSGARVVPSTSAGEALAVRTFDRGLDLGWRRTSYSGLIRAAQSAAPAVGSEPVIVELSDEPMTVEPDVDIDPADLAPIGRLPKGATFGSLVHAVLEHADPAAEDLVAELAGHAAEQLRWWPVDAESDAIAQALAPVYDTPLGVVGEGRTLRQIAAKDRLCELDFEFPLAGGDEPLVGVETRLRDLAPLLRRHLAADDPLRPYADVLEGPELGTQPLRGYLSGSIDVVLRLPSGRFVIADYKTNVLGHGLPEDYRADLLAGAMLHSHYPLQAILYAVVLHRYLTWRLPGYDPEHHLGGVLYLYLRGMTGPDATGGVFAWTPPAALVIALSETLGGRHA